MRFVERIGDQFREILPEPCDVTEPKYRLELRRILADQFHLIDPEVLVLAEDMQTWDGETSIDLLGLHKNGSLIVVALTETAAAQNAMELLAVRHAALASTLSTQNLIEAHKTYLGKRATAVHEDAERRILQFLGIRSLDALQLSPKPRIILVAHNFGSQLTQSVLWLNNMGLDIQCVRVDLYRVGNYFMLRSAVNALETLRRGHLDFKLAPVTAYASIEVATTANSVETPPCSAKAAVAPCETATANASHSVPTAHHAPLAEAPAASLHEVVTKALARGSSPQQIADVLPHIPVLFRILPGQLDTNAFKAANREFRSKIGMNDDSDAFYTEVGELFHYKGKTYALARLAGETAEKAVASLLLGLPGLIA